MTEQSVNAGLTIPHLGAGFTVDPVNKKVNVKSQVSADAGNKITSGSDGGAFVADTSPVWVNQSDNEPSSNNTDDIFRRGAIATRGGVAWTMSGDYPATAVLDVTDTSLIRVTTGGSIEEITGEHDGKIVTIMNGGSVDVMLMDTSTSGVTERGISIAGGGDFVIRPNAAVMLQYDISTLLWRYIGTPEGNILAARDVGQIGAFELTAPPSGWLALQGQTITNGKATYSDLADTYPAWVSGNNLVLPDYRDRHLEGSGAANPGVNLAQGTAMPSNPFVINSTSNSTTSGSAVGNGQWGLMQRSNGGSNTTNGQLDTSPGEPNLIAAPIGHTHGIGGGDAKTRPASRVVLWCVKAVSGVVLSQPGTEVMSNTLVVAGGTITSTVNGMPATVNFAPQSRVMFGSVVNPNVTTPIDPNTGVTAVELVPGETYCQTDTGLDSGLVVAEWKYVGANGWRRVNYIDYPAAIAVSSDARTYYPARSSYVPYMTSVQSAAQVAAHGFTAEGGAGISNYAMFQGYNILSMQATRPAVAAVHSIPTSYVRHEQPITPGANNTYHLSTITDRSNFVTVAVWVCDPVTGVPVKRLHGNSQEIQGVVSRQPVNIAPDNGHPQISSYYEFMSFNIPAAIVDAYKTSGNTIKLALTPSVNNAETNQVYIGGWGMTTNPYGLITQPMITSHWALDGALSPALNWYGNIEQIAMGSVAANANGRIRIPVLDVTHDTVITIIGRDERTTDSYFGEYSIIHTSGNVTLGRLPVTGQTPYGNAMRNNLLMQKGFVIPASTLAAKTTLPANGGVPFLELNIKNLSQHWTYFIGGYTSEYLNH